MAENIKRWMEFHMAEVAFVTVIALVVLLVMVQLSSKE